MTRVCLFAHHDPRGQIGVHVRHYLEQLHLCGFAIHVAMSGTEQPSAEDMTFLRQIGASAHPRPNRGLDFGAWQDLLERGIAGTADIILLANDSVFGPLMPLPPLMERMERRMRDGELDVWGMVESRENGWHLQSWFLCFTAAAFAVPAVARVLEQPFAAMNKNEIVLHGELGLGAAIRAAGLRWDALARQPTRQLRRLIPGNAMHLDFLSVVRGDGVPFLKVELLRDNPAAIGWVFRWRRLVRRNLLFDPAWIDRHLSGSGIHRAPVPRQTLRMRLLYALISRDRFEATAALPRRSVPPAGAERATR